MSEKIMRAAFRSAHKLYSDPSRRDTISAAMGGDLIVFPVPEPGDDRFHVRAYLLGRPCLACHVLNAEVNELLRALIFKLAARVAPLAVFLIELAVRLGAYRRIVKRHSAALTNKLPWST